MGSIKNSPIIESLTDKDKRLIQDYIKAKKENTEALNENTKMLKKSTVVMLIIGLLLTINIITTLMT